MPTLFDKEGQGQHEYLYWEFHERGFEQAVRQGDCKALRDNMGPVQLYDLRKDIHEDHDLSEQKPDIVRELQSDWDAWNASNIAPLW